MSTDVAEEKRFRVCRERIRPARGEGCDMVRIRIAEIDTDRVRTVFALDRAKRLALARRRRPSRGLPGRRCAHRTRKAVRVVVDIDEGHALGQCSRD